MDKSEIGAHLNGLPPATARGLHNLFNKLLDEIQTLRQAAHWHGPEAGIVPLDPVVEPAPAAAPLVMPPPDPTGDVLPPVGENTDPIASPTGSVVLTDADSAADLNGEPRPSSEAIPVTADGTVIESAAAAPADVPPAA